MLDHLIKKKKKVLNYILLKCKKCGSLSTYNADLFRKQHLKKYVKENQIEQFCGYWKCDRNTPHKIKGVYKESITRVDKVGQIIKGLYNRTLE